jgi:uncharacterized glyoxalase superfamily protein PhnB
MSNKAELRKSMTMEGDPPLRNLDAVYEELRAKGILFDEAPADQPWLWREAYLSDPDGNVLCLYYAGSNRRFPPWRIDSR